MTKNKSILRYIVVTFFVFTTIAISLGVLFILLSTAIINSITSRPTDEKISDIVETIIESNFAEEEIEILIDKDVILEVYDSNLNLVFSFGHTYDETCNEITKEELDVIPFYDSTSTVSVEYGVFSDGQNVITVTTIDQKDGEDVILSMYMFDSEYNVIYSMYDDSKQTFTKSEFEYLSQTTSQDYNIYKYPFSNEEGSFVMIVKTQTYSIFTGPENISKIYVIHAITFIVLYLLIFSIFMIIINRMIKKPIKMVNDAIEDFSNNKKTDVLNYKGAKEFELICESFNEMVNKLELSEQKRIQIEKEKVDFFCNISHDLKTPITVIHGYLEAIKDGLISEENVDKYLDIIYNKSKDLTVLINEFYELNKTEHPDFEFKYEEVDICEYTREYLANKYDEIEIKGFDLEVDIPDDVFMCNIDKTQFKRVYENLIGNTMDHNSPGKKIFVSINKIGNAVSILVCDNGKGINEEVLSKIFNPFVGTEKESEISGLGLYICKKFVEEHSGSIVYKSSKEYASIFEITLPIIR